MYEVVKAILKAILILFLILFLIFWLLIFLFLIGDKIVHDNSKTEGLKYTFELIESEELIGMNYSECCDLLKDAEDTYDGFCFNKEYRLENGSRINGITTTYYRRYTAGESLGANDRMNPYAFDVYFGTDDKVVGLDIFEQIA